MTASAVRVADHEPFKAVAPDLVDTATGCVGWLLDGGGVLTDLCGYERVDEKISAFIRGPLWTAALLRAEPGRGVVIVGNWLAMTGYDSGARQSLTDWVIAERKRIRQVIAIIPPQRTVVKMGLDVARAAVRLAGVQMDVTSSIPETLKGFQLRPAAKR